MADRPLSESLSPNDRALRDAWLADFRADWNERLLGEKVRLLPPAGPLRSALLVDMVRLDMEQHRARGRQPRLEAYLRLYPELNAPDAFRLLAAPLATDPPRAPAAGALFGKYRLERVLGKGGMGEVWLATDPTLRRKVAIKRPHAADAIALARLRREAQAVARLDQHPNICRIHEIGDVGGQFYPALDFVEGRTLDDLLASDADLPPRRAAEIAARLASALDYAHARGIVHRDLKPANIMVRRDGMPVVMDFGLAGWAEGDHSLTRTGAVMGTPAYMAPEQARGEVKVMGPAGDIFSLGVVLYEMLTRQRPFDGPNVHVVLYQVQHVTPARPSAVRGGIDAALEAICLKAMAKEATERYATAGEMKKALKAYLKGPPTRPVAIPVEPPQKVPDMPAPTNALLPMPRTERGRQLRRATLLILAGLFLLVGVSWVITRSASDRFPAKIKQASGIDVVLIPPGWFLMGSPDVEKGGPDERPMHKMTIKKPFYLGKTEVTVGQFKRFVQAENFGTDAEKAGDKKTWRHPGFDQTDAHPVVFVTWNDARAYCRWLSRVTGEKVRLPREAEWEYSCRSRPEQTSYPKYCFGDDQQKLADHAWYAANANNNRKSVGQKRANGFGLYDMHGNVWEWIEDERRVYRNSDEEDPQIDESAASAARADAARICRGGSCSDDPPVLRAAHRGGAVTLHRGDNVGFRVLVLP